MTQPMLRERVALAVRNNAVWCDTVCCAHGRRGEFLGDIWINRRETPPFYPNAVTLSESVGAQLAGIQAIIDAGVPGAWGVKDSFCLLDLALLGFRMLFEATWIWRSAALPRPDGAIAGTRWARVRESAELAAWEAAWGGLPAGELPAEDARIFPPILLEDAQIAFIAAYREQRIVAGAIANRTGEVAGLSNVFVPAEDAARGWAGCVAGVLEAFPGLPLVGYERGDELEAAQLVGFEALAPLRIWLRAD